MGLSVSDTPLIGLTTYVEPATHGVWTEVSALLPMEYVSGVIRAGAVPVLLPPAGTDPGAVLDVLSGLILTGGPDVDPHLYGAAPHGETDQPREERDHWESALCLAALDRDLPLLAICRGLQILNVALGGTLHQHLPEVVGSEVHRRVRGQLTPNHVRIESETILSTVLGVQAEALCHHHQAIDRLGVGMRAVAVSTDGTVEATEIPDRHFALGVQWHPESDGADDRLFKSLVDAAVAYRERGRS